MHTLARSVIAVAVLATSCGAPPPPIPPSSSTCRTLGQACASTTDCCSQYICGNGYCAVPASGCGHETEHCTSDGDCCGSLSCFGGYCNAPPSCAPKGHGCARDADCCSGLACTNGECVSPPTCGVGGDLCSTMYDCCQGSTCPRFGIKCSKGQVGDPCAEDADCLSGWCSVWCTATCTSDADCDAPNEVNGCFASTSGVYQCFPTGCTADSDCSVYGPGVTCRQGHDADGNVYPGCSK